MFVYVGKTYTSTITSRRLVQVRCEKCHTEYFYDLVRSGIGRASAPYYLGMEAAQRRAQAAACKVAEKRLMRDAEMVPCPKCRWVNQELIYGYRRSRHGWVLVTSSVVSGLVLFVLAIIALANYGRQTKGEVIGFVIGYVLPAASLIPAGWWVRWWLRNRIDPNVTYPGNPSLPVGTPPALVMSRNVATGQQILVPCEPLVRSSKPDAWITFRAGELRLPNCCSECLQPIDLNSRARLRSSKKGELPLVVCQSCRSTLLRKTWYRAFKGLLLAAGVAALAFLIPGLDAVGHWLVFALAGGFVFIVALLVNGERSRAYVMKQVDSRRSVYQVRMRKPELHAMLWETMRPRDVLTIAEDDAEPVLTVVEDDLPEAFPVADDEAEDAGAR